MGNFSLYCWVKDLSSCQTVNTIRLTHSHFVPPAYPYTQVWFANAAPLILPLDAHQSHSEISTLAASETFTQRRIWRISAGSLHSKDSVDISCVKCATQPLEGGIYYYREWEERCYWIYTPKITMTQGVPDVLLFFWWFVSKWPTIKHCDLLSLTGFLLIDSCSY